jgi:diguanylate cyclase (GGDEF)-like protein/PAS domain S-box-containing protein
MRRPARVVLTSRRLGCGRLQRELLADVGTSVWSWDVRTGRLHISRYPTNLGGEPFAGTLEELAAHVHGDDRDRLRETLARVARDGGSFVTEFRVQLAEGEISWRQVRGRSVLDRSGRPVRVVAIGQDITERKLAEARLNATELHYRTLVEQLPLASYVEQLGASSAVYISPQIADLVGYTAEEWASDPTFFGRVLHPDDRERVLAGFALMHRNGASFNCEYRLIAKDGRVVWIHDAAMIAQDESGQPAYAQGYMVDITSRKEAEAALAESQRQLREYTSRLEYQALHDALTGLPNRALFYNRAELELERARREGAGFAILLIDLDRFKHVNDTLGHLSGDELLCDVASRLRNAVRRSDTVARLGGDEFAVIAPKLADPEAASGLAEKLRDALLEPVSIGALSVEVEASVGIALFPNHGTDVETLIRRADVSMYVSKGAHSPIVYAEHFDEDSLRQLELMGELRNALDRDELTVHYQPVIDVPSGETLKVEALARWQHPERGLLLPGEFIPLAEQTGLIRAVTRYVLGSALAQCSAWKELGRQVVVSANVTGRELVDLAFPNEVANLLERWDVEPELLQLEITESSILTYRERARSVLEELAGLGLKLAVDDFGSGESSFAYLRQLPISILKVDKSYVQRMLDTPVDEALVRSVIELGHNLGLEVVAEGVESQAIADRLATLGCDTLQGFHLGRPQPAHALGEVGVAAAPERASA